MSRRKKVRYTVYETPSGLFKKRIKECKKKPACKRKVMKLLKEKA